MESNCEYVCSRGLLKSCTIHSSTPHSSISQLINYDFSNLKPNCSIYVCSSAIPHFIHAIFPQIPFPFVLVSGDCDETVPNDILTPDQFRQFIESDKIIHWYSQNCWAINPKLTQMPIGLDYHTMSGGNSSWGLQSTPLDQESILKTIKANSLPFYERKIGETQIAYSNFHFFMTTKHGYDRKDAQSNIPNKLIFYEPHKLERKQSWENQAQFPFVISPHGGGYDCHRTWEALCLGCIPIVKTSILDPMYEELPVLIVNSWSDVTLDLLQNTIEKYKTQTFNYDKLLLSYWTSKINAYE